MPANTGGGTTTSLNNTPQAKDDYFRAAEDGVYTFDVMAGDLGGSAKILWSIDNTSDDGSGDLVAKDVAGVIEYSELGAKIWIEDGKVKYDTSALDWLAASETIVDQFTYAIRLSNGTLSWATVNVTLTGSNDTPVISVGSGDRDAATLAETNLPLTISGRLTVVDADTSDVVDTVVSSVAVVGDTGLLNSAQLMAMFTLTGAQDLAANSGDSGNLTWLFDSGGEAFNFLAIGETLTLTYTIASTDDHGATDTHSIVITITGSNDAPEVSAQVLATVDEDAANPASVNLLANATDPDRTDDVDVASVGYSVTGGSWLPAVAYSVDAESGALTFDPNQFNALGGAESIELTFTYNVIDGNGGLTPATAVITITGSNDAPEVRLVTTDTAAASLAETNAGLVASGLLTVNDPDNSDAIGSSVTAVAASGTTAGLGLTNAQLLAMFAVAPASALAANANDTHNLAWNFDSDSQAFNYLNVGQSLTLTYTVTSSDGNGGSDTHDVTITVTGTGDAAPTDLVFTFTGAPGNSLPNGAFGQITTVDGNGGAGYTYSATGLTATTLSGGAAADFAGDLTVSSTGVISASNLHEDRVYQLTVEASQGGTAFSETFSIITGTNDTETIGGVAANGDDVIFARGDADIILAGSGNDTVFGQAANDQVYGGTGNDTLTGGAGNDRFYFDTALSAALNVDNILDFNATTADTIGLDNAIFAAFGLTTGVLNAANFAANGGGIAGDANDFILYDTATGRLYYDADGNGAGASILFGRIDLVGVSGTVGASDFFLF